MPSVVASGEEALEHVAASPPDLVLMDIQLEGQMDGVETAHRIWDRFAVPTVYLTANSDQATFTRAVGGAPYGYLVKPFDERTLQATVEVALKRYQDERAQMDQAERDLASRTQELSQLGHALEQHLAQWSTAAGAGNELSQRVATMVDAVTEVVVGIQAERARPGSSSGEDSAPAPRIDFVDEVTTLVNAMTEVVNVVRSSLIPSLRPPTADGDEGDGATLRRAV